MISSQILPNLAISICLLARKVSRNVTKSSLTYLTKIPEDPTKKQEKNYSPRLKQVTFKLEENSTYHGSSLQTRPTGEESEQPKLTDEIAHAPIFNCIVNYLALFIVLPFYGIVQDWLRYFFGIHEGESIESNDLVEKKFNPLYMRIETFFTRNVYCRVRDGLNIPINSCPGGRVDLLDRRTVDPGGNWHIKYNYSGKTTGNLLNLASYNYLGFANTDGSCADQAEIGVVENSYAATSPEQELGRLPIHENLERATAEFIGVDDCMIFGMGFATNSTNIPCLVDDKSLVISDQQNHSSIIAGCKLAGTTVRVFKHNNMDSLEAVLKKAILEGNPKRSNRDWSKILVIVEGIYSMEATIVNLPGIIALKEKYKFYLYLDEAHSIGAMGKSGRGVCEYFNIDPRKVDVMMGTFTKSFGAAGGYIAGSSDLIRHLRQNSHACNYANTMPAPVAQQALEALHVIGYTKEGRNKIEQLHRNASRLRVALQNQGFIVFGDMDSPVVPVLMCEIGKLKRFQSLATKYGMACVITGYPATKVTENRFRLCLSASHTDSDIHKVIQLFDILGDECGVKYKHLTTYKIIEQN